jgi:hypothetical protein
MRAWWGFALAAVVIGTSYVADGVVSRMIQEGRATFSSMNAIAVEAIVRVAIVGLVVALAWLVFRGPRSRPVGLAMALLGFIVALVPPLSLVISANLETALPPFVFEFVGNPTDFVLWAAAAVLVLGVVEIVSPTRDPVPVGAAPELAGGSTSGSPIQ